MMGVRMANNLTDHATQATIAADKSRLEILAAKSSMWRFVSAAVATAFVLLLVPAIGAAVMLTRVTWGGCP
jgi:hypothetical protein